MVDSDIKHTEYSFSPNKLYFSMIIYDKTLVSVVLYVGSFALIQFNSILKRSTVSKVKILSRVYFIINNNIIIT